MSTPMKSIVLVGIGLAAGAACAAGLVSARGADEPAAYRQLSLFSAAFARVRAEYVTPVEDSKLVDGAIEGMLTHLDPHSSYIDAKSFRREFDPRHRAGERHHVAARRRCRLYPHARLQRAYRRWAGKSGARFAEADRSRPQRLCAGPAQQSRRPGRPGRASVGRFPRF